MEMPGQVWVEINSAENQWVRSGEINVVPA
jgi:hypothetical protein